MLKKTPAIGLLIATLGIVPSPALAQPCCQSGGNNPVTQNNTQGVNITGNGNTVKKVVNQTVNVINSDRPRGRNNGGRRRSQGALHDEFPQYQPVRIQPTINPSQIPRIQPQNYR